MAVFVWLTGKLLVLHCIVHLPTSAHCKFHASTEVLVSNTDQEMEQWTYVTLPCPFGGPRSTSKTCRDGLTQLIDSTTELHNSLTSCEKALTTVQERMTNHVTVSHNLEWQDASDHVSSMEPKYWTEQSVACAMSPPNPTEPHNNECRYVRSRPTKAAGLSA